MWDVVSEQKHLQQGLIDVGTVPKVQSLSLDPLIQAVACTQPPDGNPPPS